MAGRVIQRDDYIGAEVVLIRVDGATERHVHRSFTSLDNDPEVGKLGLEIAANCFGSALLEVLRSAAIWTICTVRVRDDDAEIYVGKWGQRVSMGDRTVDIGTTLRTELPPQRSCEQIPSAARLIKLCGADLNALPGFTKHRSKPFPSASAIGRLGRMCEIG